MAKRGQKFRWRLRFTYPAPEAPTVGRVEGFTAIQVQGSRDGARYHAEGIARRGGTAEIIYVDPETNGQTVVETVTPDDVEREEDEG